MKSSYLAASAVLVELACILSNTWEAPAGLVGGSCIPPNSWDAPEGLAGGEAIRNVVVVAFLRFATPDLFGGGFVVVAAGREEKPTRAVAATALTVPSRLRFTAAERAARSAPRGGSVHGAAAMGTVSENSHG